MKRKGYMKAAVLALAAAGALALGLTSTYGQERGGYGYEGGRPGRMPAGGRPAAMAFLTAEGVDVTVTEHADGVTILVTSDNPKLAERIKAGVPESMRHLRKRLYDARERRQPEGAGRGGVGRGGRPMPPRMAGGFGLLASEEVDMQFAPRDDGVAIVLSTQNPDLAAQLKKVLPKQIEAMRRAGPAKRAQGDLLRLAASGQVKVKLTELDDGVTLTLTSDNPEVAACCLSCAARQIRHIEEGKRKFRAQERKGQRARARGPIGPNEPARRGPVEPPRRGAERRPMDREEIRDIIRQEIRRYLEEKEEQETETTE